MNSRAIIWSDEYRVGNRAIDEDHKYIFSLLNKVTEAVSQCQNREIVSDVLNQLLDYTQTHFRDEEALMIRADFPEYMSHHQSHNCLLYQVEDLLEECQRGEAVLNRSLLLFLNEWIVHHILGEDMKFSRWLRQTKLGHG
jgi:hemerythrin